MNSYVYKSVTIAIGAAVSGTFYMLGYRIAAVITASAWSAADISFEIADAAGTFVKVVGSDGALIRLSGVNTAASEYQVVPQAVQFLLIGASAQLVSTTVGSEVNVGQAAARTLIAVLAPL